MIIVAGVGLTAGCTATMRNSEPLAPSPSPDWNDVPIPEGFALIDQADRKSTQKEPSHLRLSYTGRADKTAIRDFYRRQMPLVRWTPTGERDDPGRYTLRFERGARTCTVEIHSQRGWSRGAIVNILIDSKTEQAYE